MRVGRMKLDDWIAWLSIMFLVGLLFGIIIGPFFTRYH